MTFPPKDLSTAQLHACLLAGIAPRPIAFVSTVDAAGNVNLSPFSFFNIFGSNPPTLIFSPARRVRDNTTKHTLQNIQETMVCTVNIVDYPMVEQMSLASTEYDKGVNEFVKAGLTQVASDLIAAPRVGGSPLAMECRVSQIIETGDHGGAGNLVIAEVINVHLRDDACGENGLLDVDKLDLVGRMGGSYYVRASGEALFEIPKPLRTKGIGVDRLPEHVRNSTILTGNDLGRLGNQEALPTQEDLDEFRKNDTYTDLLTNRQRQHEQAKQLISQGQTKRALTVLFL